MRGRNEGYLVGVARHDFAVDHGFVGHPGESLDYCRILAVEALVVPRLEVRYAVRFDGQRAVAVELRLIKPVRSFGKPLRAQEQHGWNKFRFGLLAETRRFS
jgi:hypothetical protein